MVELISAAADRYALAHTTPFEGQIAAAARWTEENTSSPQMMSGLAEARLLEALIVVGGASRVLEIGTFTAIGTLTMAAALGPGGTVTTLEYSDEHAAIAQRHIDASPYADRIRLVVGDALQTIAGLDGPFDLIYIDAAKVEYPAYYEQVLPKLAPRGVIVADNLFHGGKTLDETELSEGKVAMHEFAQRVQTDTRVHNVLLTLGDGVLLAWHRPAGA